MRKLLLLFLLSLPIFAQNPDITIGIVVGGSGGGGSGSITILNVGGGAAIYKTGTNYDLRTITSSDGSLDPVQATDEVDLTINRSTPGTWSAGAKQIFTPSATLAGANMACASLPSSPVNGDLACDSDASNQLKVYSNGAWVLLTSYLGTANQITLTGSTFSIAEVFDLSGKTSTKPSKTGTSPPATCVVGETFIDTDASATAQWLVCTATNTWTAQGGGGTARDNLTNTGGNWDFNPTDASVVQWDEEFVGGGVATLAIGGQGWTTFNIAGTTTYAKTASVLPNLGLLRITSGATSANGGGIMLGSTNDPIFGALGNNTQTYRSQCGMIFKLGQTADTAFRIGLFSGVTLTGTSGFGVVYDSAVDANFRLVATSGSVDSTAFNMGAADTNFHTLMFRTDGATSGKVFFKLDNGTERTICAAGCDVTATPTANSLFPYVTVVTNTNATKFIDMDKYSCSLKVGSNAADRNP